MNSISEKALLNWLAKGLNWAQVFLVAAVAFLGGFLWRGTLPPFVVDDPFWRDVLTGPPIAGVFAVLAAGIAFLAARQAAKEQRRAAERKEWWDRAEWAMNRVLSDNSTERSAGLLASVAMFPDATEAEGEIVNAVLEPFLDESQRAGLDATGTLGGQLSGEERGNEHEFTRD